MSDSIITYAVLNDEGFMVRRFQNIHEARRLRDAIKDSDRHPPRMVATG